MSTLRERLLRALLEANVGARRNGGKRDDVDDDDDRGLLPNTLSVSFRGINGALLLEYKNVVILKKIQ